ncbi:copper transporter [Pseudomonas aeruginosa]|nr:copper transporter [Pseudomonas aeruginosa]
MPRSGSAATWSWPSASSPAPCAAAIRQAIRAFEQVYERIGIPALLLQVVSGLWLASLWLPFDHWFDATPVARALQLKLLLLAATAAWACTARLRLIPKPGRREPAEAGLASSRDQPWSGLAFRPRSDRVFRFGGASEHAATLKKGARRRPFSMPLS